MERIESCFALFACIGDALVTRGFTVSEPQPQPAPIDLEELERQLIAPTDHSQEFRCMRCREEYSLTSDNAEPGRFCDSCAHEVAEDVAPLLLAEVRALGRLRAELADWELVKSEPVVVGRLAVIKAAGAKPKRMLSVGRFPITPVEPTDDRLPDEQLAAIREAVEDGCVACEGSEKIYRRITAALELCPDCGRSPVAEGYSRSVSRCDNVYGDGQCQALTITRLRSDITTLLESSEHNARLTEAERAVVDAAVKRHDLSSGNRPPFAEACIELARSVGELLALRAKEAPHG